MKTIYGMVKSPYICLLHAYAGKIQFYLSGTGAIDSNKYHVMFAHGGYNSTTICECDTRLHATTTQTTINKYIKRHIGRFFFWQVDKCASYKQYNKSNQMIETYKNVLTKLKLHLIRRSNYNALLADKLLTNKNENLVMRIPQQHRYGYSLLKEKEKNRLTLYTQKKLVHFNWHRI